MTVTWAQTLTSNWQIRKISLHLLRRSPRLNIARRAGGSGGKGCCHYSARAIWLRLYIENMQSVMSQCISLSSVWHLSSLLPSMGCSLLFGCQLSWWFYCSRPAFTETTATLWSKKDTMPAPFTQRHFPRPLPRSLFLFPSLSQTGRPFSQRNSVVNSL